MIENEVKYVLSLDADKSLLTKFKKIQIHQGYDKNGARLRKQGKKHFFNYKLKTPDGIEEFEMKISREEFNRCYPVCVEKLEKVRYTTVDEYDNTWDIDFFYSDGRLYFVMAECEIVDPTAEAPKKLLPFVEKYVIHSVSRERSSDFSSRKMSDVNYASKKMIEIKETIK